MQLQVWFICLLFSERLSSSYFEKETFKLLIGSRKLVFLFIFKQSSAHLRFILFFSSFISDSYATFWTDPSLFHFIYIFDVIVKAEWRLNLSVLTETNRACDVFHTLVATNSLQDASSVYCCKCLDKRFPALRSDACCEYGVGKQAAAPVGWFLAAFVSRPIHSAGKQVSAPGLRKVGTKLSRADSGSFKNEPQCVDLWGIEEWIYSLDSDPYLKSALWLMWIFTDIYLCFYRRTLPSYSHQKSGLRAERWSDCRKSLCYSHSLCPAPRCSTQP